MAPASKSETKIASTQEPKETAPPPEPIHAQIAALAYALWQQRGCPEGSPEVDWFGAEAQLKTEQKLSTQV